MNVLLLTSHLNPGGITSYCKLLCSSPRMNGITVTVVSGGGSEQSWFEKRGIECFKIPMHTSSEFNPKLIKAIYELRRIVKSKKIDLVHCQTRVSQWIAKAALLRESVIRMTTCHGFLTHRFFRKLLPLWGNRVIAISSPVKNMLIHDWGLSEDQISLIRHGIDFSNRDNAGVVDRNEIRKKWNINEDIFLVGGIGRLSDVKGYDTLVLAMKEVVLQQDADIRCILIGHGKEEKSLRVKVKRMGLESKVLFHSPSGDISRYYDALDVFCAPSRQEGLGLSVMEAMSRGLPVIASDVGGHTDLIEHEKTGFLVGPRRVEEWKDLIVKLFNQRKLAEKISTEAKEYAIKNFSLDDMKLNTEQTYKEVLL